MVTVVKDFIRADRLTDFKLHLKSVATMLPSFAASGHGQYSKAARLTLEHVLKFGPQVKLSELYYITSSESLCQLFLTHVSSQHHH